MQQRRYSGWRKQQPKPGQALPQASLLVLQVLPRLQGILGCKDGHRSSVGMCEMGTHRARAPTFPSRGA